MKNLTFDEQYDEITDMIMEIEQHLEDARDRLAEVSASLSKLRVTKKAKARKSK